VGLAWAFSGFGAPIKNRMLSLIEKPQDSIKWSVQKGTDKLTYFLSKSGDYKPISLTDRAQSGG